MSEDRKYKQRGYQDEGDSRRGRAPSSSGLPRTRVITAYRETVRCDQCGADLSTLFEVKIGSRCPKCEAPMHSCRNCYHFDPSARYQCAEPIKKRISAKSGANTCEHFQVRTISVKDLGEGTPESSTTPTRSEDARKALEALFKK